MKLEFGEYGGQFVAETLIPALDELECLLKNQRKTKNLIKGLMNFYQLLQAGQRQCIMQKYF